MDLHFKIGVRAITDCQRVIISVLQETYIVDLETLYAICYLTLRSAIMGSGGTNLQNIYGLTHCVVFKMCKE
jgi:hypothetical protein